MKVRSIAIALAMLALAPKVGAAELGSLCRDCQLQVGVGGTYHYWGSTGGVVIPVTLVFDHNKYEVGVFRMANQQSFYDPHLANDAGKYVAGTTTVRFRHCKNGTDLPRDRLRPDINPSSRSVSAH